MNTMTYVPKPIIKWVGGKSQIIDKIIAEFPRNMNHYHEIFLGGGSVLFALLYYKKEGIINVSGNIYAYDVNDALIHMYKNIQTNYIDLYDKIQYYIQEYNECNGTEINRAPTTIVDAKKSKENYYYWIRIQYNKLSTIEKRSINGSAMFIFLNKTCFRGVYRVGPNGFNVPFGHYTNPEIINREHLEEIHHLIQGVIFECSEYASSINNISENDFTYMDPPYAQEKQTSFVGYTENGFNIAEHVILFNLCNELTENKKKWMMSNADVPLVRQYFTSPKYKIQSILCKRSIHSKKPDSKTKEVLIQNY
jgi:DNA adenine methylase